MRIIGSAVTDQAARCLQQSVWVGKHLYLGVFREYMNKNEIFCKHLQTSSDVEVLIFQSEFFPLTNVLYTVYEYSMFNDVMFSFQK